MPRYLLDVNVLVALAWSNHVHHATIQRWFASRATDGWATCPITQAGFVRVSSNPKVLQSTLTPGEAVHALSRLIAHPNHLFWPDSLAVTNALSAMSLSGYRQVTDAYLVALAKHHGGKLATLDRAVAVFGVDVEVLT